MKPNVLFNKNKFNWTNVYAATGGDVWLSHKYEVEPEEFLMFAEKDFKQGDKHGLVNSLTNAKRAIDCQTDKIISCFGYDPTRPLPENAINFIDIFQNKNSKIDATQNLKLLHALDIVPSGLISEMRKLRHDLEHRYKSPNCKDVSNFVDLAKLFIRSTEYVLRLFPDLWTLMDTEVLEEKTNIILVEFPSNDKEFKITFKTIKELGKVFRPEAVDVINIGCNSPLFLYFVALNVTVAVDGFIEPKIIALVDMCNINTPADKVKFKGYTGEPL